MLQAFNFIEWAKNNPVVLEFIQEDLLFWVLISFLFGFVVLLIELRLPLKYYWYIPLHALRGLIEGLGLSKKTPVWGYCLDRESKQIIPVAAVELLDPNTKETIRVTYSNHLGQYGFKPPAGKYYLRAVKNEYQTPSILDPENIQLVEVKESYALPINIEKDTRDSPQLNLELQPLAEYDPGDPKTLLQHYLKNFMFALANAFLALGVLLSLFAWAVTRSINFGLLLSVCVILLFIKIYILETIRRTIPSVK